MKHLIYISLILILTSSCGCRWAASNCPDKIVTHTDTITHTEIIDSVWFDTIYQQVTPDSLGLIAISYVDSLGFVRLPETTVEDDDGNSISVRIVHDTVYARSVSTHRPWLTIYKNRLRQELREQRSSSESSETITKHVVNYKGLVITAAIVLLIYLFFKYYRKISNLLS